ncbi:MAG: radical SAM family heme chaperone HemW [Puniceicoccales bacterium]|nr:radical SAM family heme chaperone HemW [Puniceicoccales bacterium]
MQAQAANFPLGLYIHVPFCAHRCGYCAFYQEVPKRQDIELYLQGIAYSLKSLELTRPIDTIYWGGGTPGILTTRNIYSTGKWIQDLPLYISPSEWTVELSPITVKDERLNALRDIGVNRISMGVQSFSEKTLQRLGRRQNPKCALFAYDTIRQHDFQNVGLDLIFAVPDQTLEEWEEDIQKAIQLQPEHISTYNLTMEGDSKMNLSGKFDPTPCSLERERAFYISTVKILESSGYGQYEISNFCLPGHESRHNLHTWQMAEWVGIGPSASSQYDRRRYTQFPSLGQWAQALKDGKPSFILEQTLNDHILFEDSCLFGLRMREGIDLRVLHGHYPFVQEDYIALLENFFKRLVDAGYMEPRAPHRYHLTLEGMLHCDAIGADILALT